MLQVYRIFLKKTISISKRNQVNSCHLHYIFYKFLPRNAYAWRELRRGKMCVRLSVRPSVTHRHSV